MTFGESLKACRVSRGWSRAQMEIIITARFRAEHFTLTDDGIKLIEYGVSNPLEKTRAMLVRLFPELATNDYQSESAQEVSTAR